MLRRVLPTIWERTSLRGLILPVTWGGDDSEILGHELSRRFRTYLGGISGGLSLRLPDAWELSFGLSVGEQIGCGAAGFVDVTASTKSSTAVPAVLVLQRVQFMTATGQRKYAKWDFALGICASKDRFASRAFCTGAVLAACSSISLSPILASYFLSGRGQT